VSLVLWAAAHLLLFRFHLPSRYSQWALRIAIALSAGLSLVGLADFCSAARARFFSILPPLIAAVLLIYPHLGTKFPHDSYIAGSPRALLDFLRAQPNECLIATLDQIGDNIPALTRHSIFVSAEHAIPYHLAYYREIRERGQALVRAHFS